MLIILLLFLSVGSCLGKLWPLHLRGMCFMEPQCRLATANVSSSVQDTVIYLINFIITFSSWCGEDCYRKLTIFISCFTLLPLSKSQNQQLWDHCLPLSTYYCLVFSIPHSDSWLTSSQAGSQLRTECIAALLLSREKQGLWLSKLEMTASAPSVANNLHFVHLRDLQHRKA